MRDHSRIEELLALDALGALDAGDKEALEQEMAAHGPGCLECDRLRRGYEETAGRLAFSLDPVPVRRSTADEISSVTQPGGRHKPGLWGGVAAAAAVLVMLVFAAAGGYLLAPREGKDAAELAAFLSRPDVQLVPFEGETGNLKVAMTPDGAQAYVFGSDLPQPEEGNVYELWIVRGETPISVLCATPEKGSVVGAVPLQLEDEDVLAVTVESSDCPDAPTSDPILVAPVTLS